ncbi:MAG: hypothetical protein FWD11_04880 [Micrococcales bacterium]|nr:hypothetical protein [Micrococcales bacterium]
MVYVPSSNSTEYVPSDPSGVDTVGPRSGQKSNDPHAGVIVPDTVPVPAADAGLMGTMAAKAATRTIATAPASLRHTDLLTAITPNSSGEY